MDKSYLFDKFTIVSGKGNIRTVKGYSPNGTEYGSIYIWDVLHVINPNNDKCMESIELTAKQRKDAVFVKGIMDRF